MEPSRVSRPVVAESHHFVEVQDPELSDARICKPGYNQTDLETARCAF